MIKSSTYIIKIWYLNDESSIQNTKKNINYIQIINFYFMIFFILGYEVRLSNCVSTACFLTPLGKIGMQVKPTVEDEQCRKGPQSPSHTETREQRWINVLLADCFWCQVAKSGHASEADGEGGVMSKGPRHQRQIALVLMYVSGAAWQNQEKQAKPTGEESLSPK